VAALEGIQHPVGRLEAPAEQVRPDGMNHFLGKPGCIDLPEVNDHDSGHDQEKKDKDQADKRDLKIKGLKDQHQAFPQSGPLGQGGYITSALHELEERQKHGHAKPFKKARPKRQDQKKTDSTPVQAENL